VRVRIAVIPESEEERADLRVHGVTREIELAASLLQGHKGSLVGSRAGRQYLLNPSDVYYFESVDGRTFAYTRDQVYELGMRLYELEAMLDERFFRSSKSQIVNILMIESVRSEMNGRMMATLAGGDRLIVSRGDVKELKRRLGL